MYTEECSDESSGAMGSYCTTYLIGTRQVVRYEQEHIESFSEMFFKAFLSSIENILYTFTMCTNRGDPLKKYLS